MKFAAAFILTVVFALIVTVSAAVEPVGSAAALDARTVDALKAALDDERRAQAIYGAVISRHGKVLPFANVIRAEEQHEQLLLTLFAKYGVTVPVNEWDGKTLEAPATLKDSCSQAIQAEKDNIALYDGFLAFVTEPDIRGVFERLREISATRHLPAFERCVAGGGRYGRQGGRGGGYGRAGAGCCGGAGVAAGGCCRN